MSKYTDRLGERIHRQQSSRTARMLVKFGFILFLFVLAFVLYRWLTG